MTLAERLADLVHIVGNLRAVETSEAKQRLCFFERRCDIASAWSVALTELASGPALEALPAQVVKESRKQLAALQAEIQRSIAEAVARGD
jgi:hypothetical protein